MSRRAFSSRSIEVVGGLWLALVGAAARCGGAFDRATNALAVRAGTAGVLTIVPALGELGAAFGPGQLVRFGAVGTALSRASYGKRQVLDV